MIMKMIITNHVKEAEHPPRYVWWAIFTMTIFDYNCQNSLRFGFLIYICKEKNKQTNKYSPDFHKETTNWRILVVAVKWHHHTIIVLFFLGKWGDLKINRKIPINISLKNSTSAVQNLHVCALPYVNFDNFISWLNSHAVKLSEQM